jgi:hypothetical protein
MGSDLLHASRNAFSIERRIRVIYAFVALANAIIIIRRLIREA